MPSKKIKNNLKKIKTWAQENVILSPSEKNSFLEWCDELEKKVAQAVMSPLKIGLLGGTGVGKSTLINRLAGKEISVAHKKRPYTDKVIVYQHNELSDAFQKEVPSTIICKHDRYEISHLILYDFPDYDSLVTEHHKLVKQFSQELDIIVWVTSPEKYADQSMIQMMKTLLQSSKNYCFVLNKIDQLTPEDTAQVVGHWSMLLGQIEIFGAPVFAISALLSDETNNQDKQSDNFEALQKWIFKKRKEHEKISITQSNVENQIKQKTKNICQQLDCQNIDNIVNALEKINAELITFELSRQKDILEILTPDAHGAIFHYLSQQSHFLWPVGLAFSILTRLKNISEQHDKKSLSIKSPELFLKSLDKRINILQTRPVISDKNISLTQTYLDFINQYQDPNQVAPFLGKINAIQSLFFVAKQWLAISIPIVICILYLGNISHLTISFDSIHFSSIVEFVFNIFLRLFHPEGLIAMLSLTVMELFICIKIASTWHNRMDKKAHSLYSHLSCQVSKTLLLSLQSQLKPLMHWSKQAQLDCMTLIDGWAKGHSRQAKK